MLRCVDCNVFLKKYVCIIGDIFQYAITIFYFLTVCVRRYCLLENHTLFKFVLKFRNKEIIFNNVHSQSLAEDCF